MFDNLISKYQSWSNYRRAYKELSSLSDRELDDIGVSRGDINYVLRQGNRG